MVSEEEIVAELRAGWVEVSRGYARCWAAMVEVALRTSGGWEGAEIAVVLTLTTRRADDELGCAQVLVERLPRVYAALAAAGLDHHKARVFIDYLGELSPAQAERICQRLVPAAPGWTTGWGQIALSQPPGVSRSEATYPPSRWDQPTLSQPHPARRAEGAVRDGAGSAHCRWVQSRPSAAPSRPPKDHRPRTGLSSPRQRPRSARRCAPSVTRTRWPLVGEKASSSPLVAGCSRRRVSTPKTSRRACGTRWGVGADGMRDAPRASSTRRDVAAGELLD